MERIPTILSGCFEIVPKISRDERGTFIKTFHRDTFAEWGLCADFAEQFHSTSRKGVLRGLHFQTPPAGQAKLITCLDGEIFDAAVDLRRNSPTFGRHILLQLSASNAKVLYLPAGLAHGFYTFSESATVLYSASTIHAPEYDTGIRWDSAGIPWPDHDPIVSPRDKAFPPLADFQTPFTM